MDEDRRPIYKITSGKFKNPYIIKNTANGLAQWIITSPDTLPDILKGKYTRYTLAIEALTNYINKSKPSNSVIRDAKADLRQKAKEDK